MNKSRILIIPAEDFLCIFEGDITFLSLNTPFNVQFGSQFGNQLLSYDFFFRILEIHPIYFPFLSLSFSCLHSSKQLKTLIERMLKKHPTVLRRKLFSAERTLNYVFVAFQRVVS